MIPSFTELDTFGCSMSYFNDTLIYQTLNPYYDYSDCKAEFECPIGHDLVYNITRFHIELLVNCEEDHLGISCINKSHVT